MTLSHSTIEPIVNQKIAIYSNILMDQISVNTPTKTLVSSNNAKALYNNVNPDIIKDLGPHQPHTWNKTVLDVESTTKVW